MPVFFEMLKEETDPGVRVALGHFVFVYVHPYMDGNGRKGRFLMSCWRPAVIHGQSVVPLQRRDAYMAALEDASVRQNIAPFAAFLGKLVQEGLEGKAIAKVPARER